MARLLIVCSNLPGIWYVWIHGVGRVATGMRYAPIPGLLYIGGRLAWLFCVLHQNALFS